MPAIIAIYVASVVGAIGVYLMMPREGREPRIIGIILGLGTVFGLMSYFLNSAAAENTSLYYYIFTALAGIFSVLVITHSKPVYSALYFVLSVVSVSGLLILLEAEFMAFALILIYGGAILVTYMFVIMLATQPATEDDPETGTRYDRMAKSPILAVILGFLLISVLCTVMFTDRAIDKKQTMTAVEAAGMLLGKFDMDKPSVALKLGMELAGHDLISHQDKVSKVTLSDDQKTLVADVLKGGKVGVKPVKIVIPDAVLEEFVPNIDRVGLNLFSSHTLGIELAGVILLLSMVGAIVLAKKQVLPHHVEIAEEEVVHG